jgi:hypothetical protein
MDIKELERQLIAIVELKNLLAITDYANPKYDEMEEELHDLEDDLIEDFGDYLEEALATVHDEYCPDNDILLPTAYLANSYLKTADGYDVSHGEGILVEADDFPGKEVRVVLVPGPLRILVLAGKTEKLLAWKAE